MTGMQSRVRLLSEHAFQQFRRGFSRILATSSFFACAADHFLAAGPIVTAVSTIASAEYTEIAWGRRWPGSGAFAQCGGAIFTGGSYYSIFLGRVLVVRIVNDDLSSEKVALLLSEHLEGMARHSPPESVHALDIKGLRAADVTFWTVWAGKNLLGCGALKELDTRHGEIKSMRTARGYLRRGVAKAMLQHLIDKSRSRSYARLSLETGSGPAFAAADSLYRKFGFVDCGPFGSYRDDPFSRFMTLELGSSD